MPNDVQVMPACLRRAIIRWRRDLPISMTLAAELMAHGYDVPALEAAYRP